MLPAVAVALALVWQVALAGHAFWVAHSAARAGARAAALGAEPRSAVLAELPAALRRGRRVDVQAAGSVRVAVRVPRVIDAVDLGRVSAESGFEPQE